MENIMALVTGNILVVLLLGAAVVVSVFLFLWGIGIYNRLMKKRVMMQEGWGGVDVQLQRRYDMIGSLVENVRAYLTHERATLEEITRLRSAGREAAGAEQAAATDKLMTQSLGKLMIAIENYPELKSNQTVAQLQEQIALVENDLQLARRYYNATVRDYNILLHSFPPAVIAKLMSFERGAFFEINDPEAARRPRSL